VERIDSGEPLILDGSGVLSSPSVYTGTLSWVPYFWHPTYLGRNGCVMLAMSENT
jgi:hypothetical protein